MWRASLEECLAHLIQGLKTALEGADGEPAQAGDPGQVKEAVEQLSRYLAESNAAAIDYFETAAPHLRILFGAHEFEHFASLVENYAFSEAYEELMAAGERNDPRRKSDRVRALSKGGLRAKLSPGRPLKTLPLCNSARN